MKIKVKCVQCNMIKEVSEQQQEQLICDICFMPMYAISAKGDMK